MNSTTTRRSTIAVATLTSALALAGSAFGATRPDDRAGVRGPGEAVAPAQVVADSPGMTARPDNRAGILGVDSGAPDEVVAVSTRNGFNWTDAGIGAAAGAGFLALLGVGGLLAMPKRQHGRAIA